MNNAQWNNNLKKRNNIQSKNQNIHQYKQNSLNAQDIFPVVKTLNAENLSHFCWNPHNIS